MDKLIVLGMGIPYPWPSLPQTPKTPQKPTHPSSFTQEENPVLPHSSSSFTQEENPVLPHSSTSILHNLHTKWRPFCRKPLKSPSAASSSWSIHAVQSEHISEVPIYSFPNTSENCSYVFMYVCSASLYVYIFDILEVGLGLGSQTCTCDSLFI